MKKIQLELAWQPIFGGGVRGLGYYDVLGLTMEEVWFVLDWTAKRHAEEAKAFKRGGS